MVFDNIPTTKIKQRIELLGVDFLEYIPHKTYVVSIKKNSVISSLDQFGVISLFNIKPKNKIDPKIQNNIFPHWAISNNQLSVKTLLYKSVELSHVHKMFIELDYQIDNINIFNKSITITINPFDLEVLASINEVWYIEPIDPPSLPENKTGRTLHRSNSINTNYYSGRHSNGDGITGTIKLAAVAESMGTDIEIHGVGPAQRQVMSALVNSNYYEMVWVHPDVECLQLSPEIFGDNYSDGLDKIDSNGMVDVPSGPGVGVDWNWDAIKRMKTGTKIF